MISTIEEALEDFKAGKMVIIVDDADRENEGDLCIAAEKVTPEAINFMAKYGRGLICLALTEEQCEKLKLPLMVPEEHSDRPSSVPPLPFRLMPVTGSLRVSRLMIGQRPSLPP